jgi:hypothetical protein
MLASCLTLDQARSNLAMLIVPKDSMNRRRLLDAVAADVPIVLADNDPAAAGKLAYRMVSLGEALAAFEMVSGGRDDGVTAAALVALAPSLSIECVRKIDNRLRKASIDWIAVDTDIGTTSYSGEDGRSYLAARLAPSLARAGDVDRALAYAHSAPEEHRVAAFLGIAEETTSNTRTQALLYALRAVIDLRQGYRRDQLEGVANALATDGPAAVTGWRLAIEWARNRPRHEAIEVLATVSPIAAAIGGAACVDELYQSIERVLRWWP